MAMAPVAAYKAPAVLAEVEKLVEPYRTLLLIHARLKKVKREDLIGAALTDVDTTEGTVRIKGAVLGKDGQAVLTSYLRGYLSRVETTWLFPLPSDPQKPANLGVAKKLINDIINATGTGAPPTARGDE